MRRDMKPTKKNWTWPAQGVPLAELRTRLAEAEAKNISYHRQSIIGFPGTIPLREAMDVHRMFALEHANNIGYHTGDQQAEFGFLGTQELEREFVYSAASLFGSQNPEAEVDGYICFGGTEGNDHGLWLGRNRLWQTQPVYGGKRGIVVLTSFLGHYSFIKHFGRLFDNEPRDTADTNVFQEVSTNQNGEMEPQVLERIIRRHYSSGYRRFLVALNAGTTNLGSVDPVTDICSMLQSLRIEFKTRDGIGVHVHVDAAFGGLVLPFLEPDCQFGFENELVSSIIVDVHKMGYVPYSAGLFLCRKGFLRYTETPAQYLRGHSDSTVSGSRSGAIAAACWTAMHVLGRDGYTARIKECMQNLMYLREGLSQFNSDGVERVHFYPTRMNILTVSLSEDLRLALIEGENHGLRGKFCIPEDAFPTDLTNPEWEGNLIRRTAAVFRFVVMPHVTRDRIDTFIDELRARYQSRVAV